MKIFMYKIENYSEIHEMVKIKNKLKKKGKLLNKLGKIGYVKRKIKMGENWGKSGGQIIKHEKTKYRNKTFSKIEKKKDGKNL